MTHWSAFTDLASGGAITYIAPLAFVLCVTMGKEAYDDYKQHLQDQQANSQCYLVLEHPTHHSTAEDTYFNTQYMFGTLIVFMCW